MKILITGAAGFIGFHLIKRLSSEGHLLLGIDNLNDYYDPELKIDRLSELGISWNPTIKNSVEKIQSTSIPDFHFLYGDITDKSFILNLFQREGFDIVINLAAQAGVRYSLVNPDSYIQNNITGFYNILEAARRYPVQHLLYASSSSVYGNSQKTPFSENDPTDQSVSLYAATKKSNELMAHVYSHLYGLKTTGSVFLRSMGLGEDQIWRHFYLQKPF